MRKGKGRNGAGKRRWQAALLVIGALLLIPPIEVEFVRFANPPKTRPMVFYQLGALVSRGAHPPLRYRWVNLREVPEVFLKHVWISEDQRFFQHRGFDWKELEAARAQADRTGAPLRGVSTITMQCARSLFLWQGRSWTRKGLEAYYTFWMEALLSKHRILELYVNVIEFGPGIYGAEAAAEAYFGVRAAGLTREQSAMLAAILPNPTGWNPLMPGPALRRRQRRILFREPQAHFPAHLLR